MSSPKQQEYDRIENGDDRRLSADADDTKHESHNDNAGSRTIASPQTTSDKEDNIASIVCKELKQHLQATKFRPMEKDEDKGFLNHCIKFCTDYKELDVYQILAYRSTLHKPMNVETKWNHRMRVVKALSCTFTQITYIAIVLYQLIHNALKHEDKSWCRNYDDHSSPWFMNLLAVFVSSNFSFTIFRRIKVSFGLYKYILMGNYNVNWINHFWLYLGFVVNAVVLISAVWASFFIIFYTQTAKDMIWSMVSIFFICDLDEVWVDNGDYDRLKKIVQVEQEKYDGDAELGHRVHAHDNDDVEGVSFMQDQKEFIYNKKRLGFYTKCGGCIRCCYAGDRFFVFLLGMPFLVLKYATMLAAICMPFYLAVCF